MFKNITYDKEILDGKPIIKGTRISVEFILELMASGATVADVHKIYPQLSEHAIQEAIIYAAASIKNEILISGPA